MKQNTKEWIQYGSAIALITSSIALAFVSFLITQGYRCWTADIHRRGIVCSTGYLRHRNLFCRKGNGVQD